MNSAEKIRAALGPTEHELARTLGTDVSTVRRWRRAGKGLKSVKLGGVVYYPLEENLRLIRSLATEKGRVDEREIA